MKIATYNVNGVNGRLAVLLRWLDEAQPDIETFRKTSYLAPGTPIPDGYIDGGRHMATVSRDPTEFMRRHGIRHTPRVPMPRLDIGALKVHDIPLHRDQLNPNLMLDAEGDPPPDRGRTDLWPPPQEVRTNGSSSESSE